MAAYPFPSRGNARRAGTSFPVLLACVVLGLALMGSAAVGWGQEFPRGASVRALGFYDEGGGRERLVALLLFPSTNGPEPKLWSGPRIVMRPLGTGSPERFVGAAKGMTRKVLVEKGQLRAAVYSLSTADGDYVNVVTYLFGGNQIVIDDPANMKPVEGSGGSDGGGDGGGGH
jgi:hypothetical protein